MRNKKLYFLMAVMMLGTLLFTACQPTAEAEESGSFFISIVIGVLLAIVALGSFVFLKKRKNDDY